MSYDYDQTTSPIVMVFARTFLISRPNTLYTNVSYIHIVYLNTVLLQFSFPLKDKNGGCTVYLSVSSLPKAKIKDNDSQR